MGQIIFQQLPKCIKISCVIHVFKKPGNLFSKYEMCTYLMVRDHMQLIEDSKKKEFECKRKRQSRAAFVV